MRIVLLLLTLTAGAFGGAVFWLSDAQDDELAVVRDVGAGGMARMDGPASTSHPTAPKTDVTRLSPKPSPVAVTAEKKLTDSGAQIEPQRFFGAGLASQPTQLAAPPVAVTRAEASRSESGRSEPIRSESWQTDVVLAQRNQSATGAAAMVVTSSLPTPRDVPRDVLVRDLQRELKRVGCYSGDATGDWNAGTKRALLSFLERANSRLPTAEPDLFQLTLVRGYSGFACRQGEPATITARAEPIQRTEPPSRAMASQKSLVAVRPLPQQPAAGTPQLQSAPSPAVAALSRSEPPSQQPAQPPVGALTAGQSPVVIYEGRMAIGGPRVPEAPDASANPAATSDPAVPPPRVARPRPAQSAAPAPQRRRDRAWTANFFNQ